MPRRKAIKNRHHYNKWPFGKIARVLFRSRGIINCIYGSAKKETEEENLFISFQKTPVKGDSGLFVLLLRSPSVCAFVCVVHTQRENGGRGGQHFHLRPLLIRSLGTLTLHGIIHTPLQLAYTYPKHDTSSRHAFQFAREYEITG